VALEALQRIREVLVETTGDPLTERLRQMVLEGRSLETLSEWTPLQLPGLPQLAPVEQFLKRARAGLGGLSPGGTMIAVHVGDVPVVGVAWSLPIALAQPWPPVLVLT
jgi:hypothetical protein